MKSQILLVLVLLGCPILETARCDQTNTVQSLGVSVFPVVTNGIVFIDGEYIPPPYRIRRDENAVLINGKRCFVDNQWPWRPYVPPKPPKPPKERPEMPAGITAKTAYEDARVFRYEEQIRLYLFDKFGEEKGMDMMVEVYKQLPFITDAKRYGADSIRLWVLGRSSEVKFVIRQRNFQDWGALGRARSPDDILFNLEMTAQRWVRILSENSVLIPDSTGETLWIEDMLFIAGALQKANNEAEFLALIPDSFLLHGIDKHNFKNFWKHREQAPDWESRAKKILADYLEEHLSHEAGMDALEAYLRAAPSADALIATLQAKRPRLLDRIVGKDAEGNPISSQGLFTEQELREFFKNRNNPEGWRPKPPPPYKPPSEIIATISAALAKAKTETEFRATLAGKFNDNDWHDGFASWDKFLASIWERRNNPGGWRLRPSAPPSVSTNTPSSEDPAYVW